jgi:hypothetical protein
VAAESVGIACETREVKAMQRPGTDFFFPGLVTAFELRYPVDAREADFLSNSSEAKLCSIRHNAP